MNMNDDSDTRITVKKCGIRFKPPAVVAYYERCSSKSRKLRERVMPLRNFDVTSNVKESVSTMRERHHVVLGQVSIVQLERLARIVQLNMEGLQVSECLKRASDEFHVDPDEDLNKVGEDVLRRKKEVMDETFEVNRKKPGDPDFQYDVQVNFDNRDGQIETSGWDSDDNDNDSIF